MSLWSFCYIHKLSKGRWTQRVSQLLISHETRFQEDSKVIIAFCFFTIEELGNVIDWYFNIQLGHRLYLGLLQPLAVVCRIPAAGRGGKPWALFVSPCGDVSSHRLREESCSTRVSSLICSHRLVSGRGWMNTADRVMHLTGSVPVYKGKDNC